MINPFTLMHPGFLNAFLNRKFMYLVVQNFTLENNLFKKPGKNYVLISHYADKGIALQHYEKIKTDTFSNYLDLTTEADKEEFKKMIAPDSNYVAYSSYTNLEATKKAIDKQLKYKIQKYLAAKNWPIPRDYDMAPVLVLQYGVLQVVLNFGIREIKVPLSELETYK